MFEEFWKNLESFFDEKNRQIIIHSKKVKPIWHIRNIELNFQLFSKVE